MDKTTAGAILGVLALLVTGFIVLSVRGVATTDYLLFLSGPIVSALVGLVLTKRTVALQNATDTVVHQTNSLLTNRLDKIEGEVTGASAPLLPAQGAPDRPAGEVPIL